MQQWTRCFLQTRTSRRSCSSSPREPPTTRYSRQPPAQALPTQPPGIVSSFLSKPPAPEPLHHPPPSSSSLSSLGRCSPSNLPRWGGSSRPDFTCKSTKVVLGVVHATGDEPYIPSSHPFVLRDAGGRVNCDGSKKTENM
uniref:Uncharacterized protein n=1 Tax=Zea mays TaxID=4577 RepID=A0A804U9X5_MAIZE